MLAMLRTTKASPGWKFRMCEGQTRESEHANTRNCHSHYTWTSLSGCFIFLLFHYLLWFNSLSNPINAFLQWCPYHGPPRKYKLHAPTLFFFLSIFLSNCENTKYIYLRALAFRKLTIQIRIRPGEAKTKITLFIINNYYYCTGLNFNWLWFEMN